MIGVPLSSAPLTASAIAPSRATVVGGGGAPGVSACWSPPILPSPSNWNVRVAVPSTDPGGSVPETFARVAVDDRIRPRCRREHRLHPTRPTRARASRPVPLVERAAEGHVVGEHRRQCRERVVGPARRRFEVATDRLLLFGHRQQLCRARGIETRPGWEQRTTRRYLPPDPTAAPTRGEQYRA